MGRIYIKTSAEDMCNRGGTIGKTKEIRNDGGGGK